MPKTPAGASFVPLSASQIPERLALDPGQELQPFPVLGLLRAHRDTWSVQGGGRPLAKDMVIYFQADSAGDRKKSKGGGKMNEEISSDSESER